MSTSTTGARSPPLRVLLAEDNPVNQTLAVLLLGKLGHTVVVVSDGRQVLEALERESFDVVFMDLQMPELDGFETTAAIRAREKVSGRHVPIIALTAQATEGDRQRCLAAGMDGYLAKPLHEKTLAEALAEMPTSTDGVALDRAGILRRVRGNEDNLRQLVAIFNDESVKLMAQIREAVANKQAARMRLAAHSLKGAIAIFGATAAEDAAQTLEDMGQLGSLTGAEQVADLLAGELEQLRLALTKLLEV